MVLFLKESCILPMTEGEATRRLEILYCKDLQEQGRSFKNGLCEGYKAFRKENGELNKGEKKAGSPEDTPTSSQCQVLWE